MASRSVTPVFDAGSPAHVARFWAELLGRQVVEDRHGLLVQGDATQLDLRFVPRSSASSEVNLLHLHLSSASLDHQRATVDSALRLGARHLDVGQSEQDEHVVLADPEGNAFCVIEPDNAFLAGCGFLAEVACDGSRDVGVFWSRALEWPLVWDQDDETAVQSLVGGTKVAWGGGSEATTTRPGQRLALTLSGHDPEHEIDRLVRLGATRIDADTPGRLRDPDGAELWVLS